MAFQAIPAILAAIKGAGAGAAGAAASGASAAGAGKLAASVQATSQSQGSGNMLQQVLANMRGSKTPEPTARTDEPMESLNLDLLGQIARLKPPSMFNHQR